MKNSGVIAGCLIVFALLLITMPCNASTDIMLRPLKYDVPYKNMDLRPVDDSGRGDNVWYVMAIRENAYTSSTPGGSDQKKQLRFGERYFVTDEEGLHVRLVCDDRRVDLRVSETAEDFGWVHKNDVLMWRVALVNPETNIDLKGMILNTTKALGSRMADYRRIQAFKDPNLKYPTNYEARLFEIFYIYQYSPDDQSVLLGRRPYFSQMPSGDADQIDIVGWVDLNRVMEWDHRVAVEPNYSEEAVNERRRNNLKTTVFSPMPGNEPGRCAEDFMRGRLPSDCDIAWNDDIYGDDGKFERKNGYWRRFPVIGDYHSDIYKMMIMGELRGETGHVLDQDADVEVRRKLNEMITNTRNINVVFAIDGTRSMGPYYKSVINSVQRIVDAFEATGAEHKNLRFGYVIYRDYLEGDRLIEHQQLTSNSDIIMRQLRQVDAWDYDDIYTHEAVFYGLRETFRRVFTNPDETNILIQVGDAGNHSRDDPTYVSMDEIIDLLVEYKCYYIAYQVHHTSEHPAYQDFSDQIKEIMTKTSDRLYYEWVRLLGNDVIEQRPELIQIDRNISRINHGPPMVLISTQLGEELDLDYLEEEITLAIQSIDNYTDNVVERSREMLERGGGITAVAGEADGTYASSFAPGVYNFLVRLGLDEQVLHNYYSANVQFVMEGYANRYHSQLTHSLFTPVLLLERAKFFELGHRVGRLVVSSGSSSDRREMLYDAWMSLLNQHIGIQSDSYWEEVSLEEAASMVFGVPMRSTMLQQIQLKDIHDRSIFPDDAFFRYINQIEHKERRIREIFNSEYPYSFRSNDTMYYWIDVDILP